MAVSVKFSDNSRTVLRQMDGNVEAALEAMGVAATGMIVRQMQGGYGKPIRQTGDLQRDVQHEVYASEGFVRVGNTLNYSIFVHEGTYKMRGRAYISDALSGKSKELGQVAASELGKGF